MADRKHNIKIGYAPTRRELFSREEAGKHKKSIEEKIKLLGVDLVNLDWLNEEGLLFDARDIEKIAGKFTEDGVDAIFAPHCNFGTEDAVAKLAKKLNKPLLIWGPRDDMPLFNGSRSRDSQCGLFATSKVLQRFGVPFSYITNCHLEDETFEHGFMNFTAAAAVTKAFRNLRIGQIGTRPGSFWSVICNEGELLERFGIEVVPTTIISLVETVKAIIRKDGSELKETINEMKEKVDWSLAGEETMIKCAALKLAIKAWAESEGLSAVAIQCWTALQDILGIMPCFVNAELTDCGLPVVCETDIHGAVTAVMLQAARMGETPIFFSDLTIRHPQNDNGELLWHCGSFPYSLKKEGAQASIGNHYILPSQCPGVAEWEIKGGDVTLSRFDGINGEYSLMMGHGKGIEGPRSRGTYMWVEVNDWPKWEWKFIYGPYIHHCAGIHGKVAPVLYEACRYIPYLKADPVDPTNEEIVKYLREYK